VSIIGLKTGHIFAYIADRIFLNLLVLIIGKSNYSNTLNLGVLPTFFVGLKKTLAKFCIMKKVRDKANEPEDSN